MAFYTGVDKERYDAGNKFLPMDQFLLDYQTPTTNTEEEVTTSYGIPAAAKSYKGYPSYADWLAAQGGTGGDGADEEDGPSYGRDYGTTGSWSPGGTYKNPNSMFSQLQNIPTPFNLAMKGITWGLNKFGAWNEARKEKKEQELKEEIKSHNIQAAISTREDKSGATGTRAGGFTNPGKGSYGPHKKDGGRIYLNLGGLASMLGRVGLMYGGNPNEERSHSLAGTHVGENAARADGPDNKDRKKLTISPVIDTTWTELGVKHPTGVVGFNALTPFGKLKATMNLKNYVTGDDVEPTLDYQGNIGPVDVNATYSDDVQNINASINKNNWNAGVNYDAITGEPTFGFNYSKTFKHGGLAGLL